MGGYLEYPEYKDSGVEWLGEVPAHWKLKRAKHMFLLQRGYDLPREEMESGDYPVCASNGVIGYHSRFNVKAPSITVGRSGSVGEINYIESDFWAHNTALFVKFFFDSFPRFVYYLLTTLDTKQFSFGTAVGTLNRNHIHRQFVAIPSLNEQESIARFLDYKTAHIDALIAKKENLLAKLAEKRTALISQAVTKGLDPTVPLKPSGIEWLGDIPAHWKVAGLTKYLRSLVDYRGKTPEKTKDGVFLVTAKNIKDGKINYALSQEYVAEEAYSEIMRRGKPEIGDVLLTTEAPLGEVANVDNTSIALAQRVIKMQGKDSILDNYFLKYWIMGSLFQQNLSSLCTGSTALGIKASKLCLLRVVLPPIGEQKQITDYLDIVIEEYKAQIELIKKAIEGLREYRTALITNAVTGKIDVRDVRLPELNSLEVA